MEIFGNYVNGFRLLVISAKDSILDVWQGSQYTSVAMYHNSMNQLTRMNNLHFTTFTLDINWILRCQQELKCRHLLFKWRFIWIGSWSVSIYIENTSVLHYLEHFLQKFNFIGARQTGKTKLIREWINKLTLPFLSNFNRFLRTLPNIYNGTFLKKGKGSFI